MKYQDLISGIFWLIVGLLCSIWGISYPIGHIINPGPGFFPLVVGILLVFFSFILLGKAKKPSLITGEKLHSSRPGRWKNIAYTILVLILATFLFEKIGYLLNIFLLMIFLTLGAESQSWKKTLISLFSSY